MSPDLYPINSKSRYGPPSAEFLKPRIDAILENLRKYKELNVITPHIDIIRWWVYFLRFSEDGPERVGAFITMFKNGTVAYYIIFRFFALWGLKFVCNCTG